MANVVGFDDAANTGDGKHLAAIAGAASGILELSALLPAPGLRRAESSEALNISLHQCARDGNVDNMRRILDQLSPNQIKRRINQHDEDLLSPLHYASRYNHFNIVKLLVDRGANVNDKGEDNATPLHYAARYRRQRVIRSRSLEPAETVDLKLVANNVGDEENEKTTSGAQTDISTTEGHQRKGSVVGPKEEESIVRYLVQKGAKINACDDYGLTPLHYAGMRGNEVAAKDLLSFTECMFEATDKGLMTALHLAATHNQVEVAQLLIDAGCSLRCLDEELSTPLHLACSEGSEQIVRMLFEAGEKLDGWVTISQMVTDQDCDGSTALHVAVENSHFEVAKLCIEKGADVNTHRTGWNTALHLAAISGDIRIVKLLLDHNARIDVLNDQQATPLHRAASFNHAEVCQFLIDRGAQLERKDKDNFTPLLLASSEGHDNTIKALLQRKADIEAVDKNDKTAIYWAAEEDNIAALEVLLTHPKIEEVGLIDKGDRYDNTPLHIACQKGFTAVVKSLLDHGADLDAKNEEEQTPLHLACRFGRTNVVRELVKENKMVVNDEDEDSNTPLHLAALSGHTKVAVALIEASADIEARNCNLWTPLDCAAAKGWVKTCRVLLENDCPVDPMDKSKTTPLHLASAKGHSGVVRLLLSWHANVRQVDSDGNNCLDLAIDNNHKQVALTIINSERWMDSLRNQTKDLATGMRNTPMRKLIRKMPDVAEVVFMKCTTANYANPEHPKYKITFNYEFLDDMYAAWHEGPVSDSGSSTGAFDEETKKLKPDAQPYTKDTSVMKKNHCLMIMVTSKREDLLAHPLVTALLRHKWNSYGRYFYYVNLLFYLIFLLFLTGYVVSAEPHAPRQYKWAQAAIDKFNGTQCEKVRQYGIQQNKPLEQLLFTTICKYAIMVLAGVQVIREVFQIYQAKANYFGFENLIEWVTYVSALLLVIDIESPCQAETGYRLDWQWQLGAVSVFWAWIELVLFIRKVPRFGIYVVMFTDVFGTFMRFLPVFMLFLIAFALSFFALLGNQVPFRGFGSSLLKSAVMMIGEFEFDTTFNTMHEAGGRTESSVVWFEAVTIIQFVLFLVIMTILIMNLLVGLAVDDIKAVQDQAVLKRLAMQVELALDVESFVPAIVRRKYMTKSQTIKPNHKVNWFRRTFTSEGQLSAASIAQALNPELDQIEKVQEEQEKLVEQVDRMRLKMKEISTQNQNITEMLRALVKNAGIGYLDEDAVDDEDNEVIDI
ncbi:transient receptor potential cation channel subfamily A member 1 homolog isoform X2 [Lineus longissimus]|uniref:transient receptor potential cation channel subfamily A member 1 homolog isoform X2 n=1 Tax=Lineus longissimus TaxID=88925 RepID=UPI002B4DF536